MLFWELLLESFFIVRRKEEKVGFSFCYWCCIFLIIVKKMLKRVGCNFGKLGSAEMGQ